MKFFPTESQAYCQWKSKCQCAYPTWDGNDLRCGPTYCEADTVCMDDGSCCPKERYCEAGFDKVCCPEGQTCDGMGACITQCDSDTQHQCSNDTVSWCCDIGKSCGENATCIQCSPDNAKNDEALCIACGWEWTVWHRHGENIYSTGCGGNNWCQSKYPGSQWGVLVQKSDGDTEYWCLGQATCGPNETWFTWEDEYSSGGQCMEDG